MTEPKDIFSRWSQRKRDVAKAEQQPAAPELREDAQQADKAGPAPSPGQGEVEPFDLSKLPSIDSIMEGTDIRDFLKPEVPDELRRAALRRAWVTDPAIRDFVGLQENDWDFNSPNGKHGFGAIGPEHDVKEMVARVFGKRTDEDGVREIQNNRDDSTPPLSEPAEPATAEAEADRDQPVDEKPAEDIATQQDEDGLSLPPRRHGGALPT